MRIRRLEAEWVDGKAMVDLRGESGSPLSVVGIVGGNGSGKSLLQKVGLRLFVTALDSRRCFLDWDDVSGYMECEYGGAISSGVVKKGKIIQNMVFPQSTMNVGVVDNGCLFYSSSSLLSGNHVGAVLADLYKGKVSNSVLWVDSFDFGLDDSSAREFLKVLIKKSLERDNQLIVSTVRRELLSGIGDDGVRVLTGGTNVVEAVLKGLR